MSENKDVEIEKTHQREVNEVGRRQSTINTTKFPDPQTNSGEQCTFKLLKPKDVGKKKLTVQEERGL